MEILNPDHVSEVARAIAGKIVATKSFALGVWSVDTTLHGMLADALEESGVTCNLLLQLRNGNNSSVLWNTIETIHRCGGEGFRVEWERQQAEEIARAEREAKLARDRVCLFAAGVTGCAYTLKELQSRITRKRPKGSGSKNTLAKRLEATMNKLADRRWKQACKGQRKASDKQAAEVIATVELALQVQQGRARERKIEVADVIRVARKADANRYASTDGGRVTANNYGYSWSTTTASARRNLDGTITVSINRDGRPSVVTFPARVWATV